MPTANWSVISHGGRFIHDIIHINTYISSQPVRHTCSLYYGHGRHTCYRLSLYTKEVSEGLPWKITVNNWSIQKKQQRERRSRRCIKRTGMAFPSDSNPDCSSAQEPTHPDVDVKAPLSNAGLDRTFTVSVYNT